LGGRDGKVRAGLLTYPRRRTWNASGGTSSPDSAARPRPWLTCGSSAAVQRLTPGSAVWSLAFGLAPWTLGCL